MEGCVAMTPAQEARQNAMFDQQADMEQQEREYYRIAARLHFCVLDGYLTAQEMENCLYAMGILTEWKKGKR